MTALCDITKCNMQEYFVVVYNLNFLKLSTYSLKIHGWIDYTAVGKSESSSHLVHSASAVVRHLCQTVMSHAKLGWPCYTVQMYAALGYQQ